MALDRPASADHNFNEVIVTCTRHKNNESFEITGKASEGFKITRNEPKYSEERVSGDGKLSTRSTTNNRSGKMTIPVEQHSQSNRDLAKLDLEEPENDRFDVSITDRAGKVLYEMFDAYLSKYAEMSIAKDAGAWEHEISSPYVTTGKDI